MSRHDVQRLDDIRAACAAIREHLTHGDLHQGLIFDAVRARLIEIGAVKAIDPELLATEPGIPWAQIARMRDQLAHPTSTPRTPSSRAPSRMIFRNSRRPSPG